MDATNKYHNRIDLIGMLPKCFIAAAFFNFLVGACLGGWMAVQTSAWGRVGLIHGEINPFGWLTMLIYGMTYAVLVIAAGLRSPKAWVGWLQFVLAELAVVTVTVALILGTQWLYVAGLSIQFIAPVVFLANILSAVFSRRRKRSDGQSSVVTEVSLPPEFMFLGKSSMHQAVDRVGQRGTDVSLMVFLVGAGWMLVHATLHTGLSEASSTPTAAQFLVYYGWIAGTVLSVALHLFPRFFGSAGIRAMQALTGQAAWGLALVLFVIGSVLNLPVLSTVGECLLGLAFAWFGILFLRLLAIGKQRADRYRTVPRVSQYLWFAAWTFSLILGICLLAGLDPLSLAALHLLFLAFTTNLVYGIGYMLFPLLLQKVSPPAWVGGIQAAAAVVGALLMVIAFLNMQLTHIAGTFALLAIGGALAAIGAIIFVLQWLFFTKSA